MSTQIVVTDADIAALIQAAMAFIAKLSATAEKLDTVLDKLDQTVDAGTVAIPAIQASVKEIADAANSFEFTGPLGMKGGSKK
jgi:hypothetical protein